MVRGSGMNMITMKLLFDRISQFVTNVNVRDCTFIHENNGTAICLVEDISNGDCCYCGCDCIGRRFVVVWTNSTNQAICSEGGHFRCFMMEPPPSPRDSLANTIQSWIKMQLISE